MALMRKEVLELEKKIIQHLNNEMKLIDEMESLNLTDEENDVLVKAHLDHDHVKRIEKTFGIDVKDWIEKLVKVTE